MRSDARAAISQAWWGQHEAAWIAFYTFCRDVVGVQYDPVKSTHLDLWAEVAQSCGWWWPYKGLCVVSERPSIVKWENGVLHCADGPALEFRDGYRLFMWRGTAVPEPWITAPKAIDPKIALTWENIEQRRAAAEIIGWSRVIEQLSPRVIDKHENPEIGELIEVELPNSGLERFLKVRCGTGRDFVLCVPREMKTALEANAWTYDIKPRELLKSEART